MGTPGLGIKGAAGRKPGTHALLGGERRYLAEPGFDLALKGKGRAREAPIRFGKHRAEAGCEIEPGGGDRNPLLGDLLLQGIEPAGLCGGSFAAQQAHALGGRLLIGIEPAGMAGIEAEHEPVEEAPARRFGIEEEPVHLGCEPEYGQTLGETRQAALGRAVDAQ